MYTLAQPQKILKCAHCKVTFVPETSHQKSCFNCTTIAHIRMRVKARKSLFS